MNQAALRTEFERLVGPANVLSGDAIGDHYRTDMMGKYRTLPAFVLRPATTEAVSQVMKLAAGHGLPVTVVGGHTGTVGGAIPSEGGISLSLERMNRIEEIDTASMTMTVEAGCILQVAQQAVEDRGAFLPLDLGSRGSAMIGGSIGANAGGNRVLRWGMMRDMVLGLEAVLADGTVVSSLTKMIKDNAGYSWKHLLIGSEGTLGIVTKAVLRLRPLPTTNQTALVAAGSFDDAVQLLRALEVKLSGRLSSFELMWDDFYEPMTDVERTGRPRPLKTGYAFYALLEAFGGDPESDVAQFERAVLAELEAGTIQDAVIAQSERERQALWAVREDFGPCLATLRPFTAYDVSMGLADMAGFATTVRSRVSSAFPGARMMFYGHAGDGNLHAIIHVGADGAARAHDVDALVYNAVGEVHGSIAAEHGIGMSRMPFLGLTRSEAELALMRTLKAALDPKGILNPGKLLP